MIVPLPRVRSEDARFQPRESNQIKILVLSHVIPRFSAIDIPGRIPDPATGHGCPGSAGIGPSPPDRHSPGRPDCGQQNPPSWPPRSRVNDDERRLMVDDVHATVVTVVSVLVVTSSLVGGPNGWRRNSCS